MTSALLFLSLLFAGSGCAALVYEVVWFQLLPLALGSSAVSMAVLLGAYMGGMCVGSVWMAYRPERTWRLHPLRVYAVLELAIGAWALFLLAALPAASGLSAALGTATRGLAFRGLFAGLCLLPPAAFMGATLPAVARSVEASRRGVSWLGCLYAANTAGGVGGAVLAGYFLLRAHDVTFATWVGVVLNVLVATAAWALSTRMPAAAPTHARSDPEEAAAPSAGGSWPVYAAIGISGATALGAEVIFTRLLSLLLGPTVYTFSLIVAVLLAGIGVGSFAGAALARAATNPRTTFGACQCLLVLALLWAAHALAVSLPSWPIMPSLSQTPAAELEVDLVRCVWAVFPAACLWGASFPLALASAAREGLALDRVSGGIYAANTVGAILGATLASLVLIPALGTQASQRVLVAATAFGAALLLVPVPAARGGALTYPWKRVAPSIAALALLRWVTFLVPATPAALVAYGHDVALHQGPIGEVLYVGEGMNSSMAVTRIGTVLNYHNAGKIQASSMPADMRLERMLGHLATLVPEHPSEVLVIGCGAGVTAGAVSVDPAVVHETIAEIETLVPKEVAPRFSSQNFEVASNPKVHVEIDDARHFVTTTRQTFDAVTSDPFDPWVKGAAALYTAEFFELVKRRLAPGGVVTVFVQLYESGEDAVKSEIATFAQAFPDTMVFANTIRGQGYDVVLLGRAEPAPIDIDGIEQRLARPEYARVRESLREVGFESATQLFSTFTAGGEELAPWLADAQINRDRNLRLEYLAGFAMSLHEEGAIYRHIRESKGYPTRAFLGSAARLAALRSAIDAVR
ncbi:MAG TPA: fused MFS/spermidine synthase [Polyangiaceae bacterium]